MQFDRPRQCGQTQSNPVQSAGLIGLSALCGLDGFPVYGLLLCGFIARLIAKYMRMTGNHFIADRIGDRVKGEKSLLLSNRGVIDCLQQQIAQLSFQIRHISARNGIGDLIGLFDRIGGNGAETLLNIPRAARVRVAQATHDIKQTFNTPIFCV